MKNVKEFQWLSDIQRGDVIFLTDPVRVGLVQDTDGYVEVRKKNDDGTFSVERQPAAIVQVGIPTKPIEGYLDKKSADNNSLVFSGMKASSGVSFWSEIWCERPIGVWRKVPKSNALERSDKEFTKQLYVNKVEGIRDLSIKSSGLLGKAIEGVILPSMPDGVFENVVLREIKDSYKDINDLPMDLKTLTAKAEELGVDISDIDLTVRGAPFKVKAAIQNHVKKQLQGV